MTTNMTETGYQQQEERCKSGTKKKNTTTRLQDAWQRVIPHQTKEEHQNPSYKNPKN